jgi:peptide-methionine (R)-S-oxide reductase
MDDQKVPRMSRAATDEHWRRVLSSDEYNVLRLKHTEPAGSGQYDQALPASGHFACRACRRPLYSAESKFQSGCGWPAFSRSYAAALRCEPDLDNFHACGGRVEIMCKGCSGHLGHVFFETAGSCVTERHCVNSLSICHVEEGTPGDVVETSIREEYDDCMQRMLMVLSGQQKSEVAQWYQTSMSSS